MGPRCRLCLAIIVKGEVVNIFTYTLNNSKESLVHVLSQVFAVEIDATDQFEKDVCGKCIKFVEYVLLVRNKFQMCQEDLRKCIPYKKKDFPADKLEDNSEYHRNCEPSCEKTYVRVSSENLDAMCQVSVDLTPWENSVDCMSYRKLSNGAYKPRKHRHFKLDDNLINDICSSLDEIKKAEISYLSKDIGTNTDKPWNTCDCKNNTCIDTDNITNIINVTENISPSYLKKSEKACNRPELKGNVSNSTFNWQGTVRVGIQELYNFAQPKVILEPVENLIKRKRYEEVGADCYYIKSDGLNNGHYKKNRNAWGIKKRRLLGYDNNSNPSITGKRKSALNNHHRWKQTFLNKPTNGALLERVETRRLSIKKKRKNHTKLNEALINNINSERQKKEIDDNRETGKYSEIETENDGGKHIHNPEELSIETSSTIPCLLDHDYGKRPGTNAKCEILFKVLIKSVNNRINNKTTKSTSDKTKTYTSKKMGDNFIDSPTHKEQQPNSKTNRNIFSRVKHQQLRNNRFLEKYKKVTSTPENEAAKPSYIWERNCLGKYSAINFYKRSSANTSNISALQCKKDVSLNETILKLAGRLDDPVSDECNTGVNKK